MSLTIQTQDLQQTRVLALIGRLDTETAPDFELAAYDAMQIGIVQFIVDMQGISYVSSAGLRVLLSLAKKLEGQGGLKIVGLAGIVREVFDKSGFSRMFAIFPDVQAALSGQRAAPTASQSADLTRNAASILGTAPPQVAMPTEGFFGRLLRTLGLRR